MMQYLAAVAVAGLGYLGYRKVKGQKILPTLSLTPIGAAIGASPVHQTLADQVAQGGKAKSAAMDLYGYLKAHGADNSPTLSSLILAFQSTSNTDPNAVTLSGPLPTSGVFDAKTSAALTLYSHDPIPPATPPAPSPPPPPALIVNMAVPGAAATSGFNLYTYLQKNGNNKSADLQKLVMQFQLDVNTDPKFAGPANQTGLPTIIKSPVPTSGTYDAATQAALKVMAPDAPSP